jgi:hypothetical protein
MGFHSDVFYQRRFSHRLLGTPNDTIWPGVSDLPDYKATFPKWSQKPIEATVNGIDGLQTDLLLVSFFRPLSDYTI